MAFSHPQQPTDNVPFLCLHYQVVKQFHIPIFFRGIWPINGNRHNHESPKKQILQNNFISMIPIYKSSHYVSSEESVKNQLIWIRHHFPNFPIYISWDVHGFPIYKNNMDSKPGVLGPVETGYLQIQQRRRFIDLVARAMWRNHHPGWFCGRLYSLYINYIIVHAHTNVNIHIHIHIYIYAQSLVVMFVFVFKWIVSRGLSFFIDAFICICWICLIPGSMALLWKTVVWNGCIERSFCRDSLWYSWRKNHLL